MKLKERTSNGALFFRPRYVTLQSLARADRIGRALSRPDGRRALSLGQELRHEPLSLGDPLDLDRNRVNGAFESFEALSSLRERRRRQRGCAWPFPQGARKANSKRTQDENDRDD